MMRAHSSSLLAHQLLDLFGPWVLDEMLVGQEGIQRFEFLCRKCDALRGASRIRVDIGLEFVTNLSGCCF
jgi:hypothetical protein